MLMKCHAPISPLLAAPFLALMISAALAAVSAADLISLQDPATGDGGYSAQDFEEKYDVYDTYQLDDLDLGQPGWYLESAVTYWYYGIVDAEFYRIRIYSDLPDSWDTNQYFVKEYRGVSAQHGPSGFWEVTFDLGGDAYSGTIWIAGYVRADFEDAGQDFWWNANAQNLGYETNGSKEYVWFWGSGWKGPEPGHYTYGETADLSWKIEGTPIPEPGLVGPLVVAALCAWRILRGRG
jgi:hypothetical protein